MAFLMIAFSSCSGYADIEKRHYRNGYYVSTNKVKAKCDMGKTANQESTFVQNAPEEMESNENSFSPKNGQENKNVDSIIPTAENKLISTESNSEKVIPIKNKIQGRVKVVTNSISKHSTLHKNKYSKFETRASGKTNRRPGLLVVAIALLFIGLLLAALSGLPALGFLFLIAGIIALICGFKSHAKTKKQNNNPKKPEEVSKEKREEYLRKKHNSEDVGEIGGDKSGNNYSGLFLPIIIGGLVGFILVIVVIVGIISILFDGWGW